MIDSSFQTYQAELQHRVNLFLSQEIDALPNQAPELKAAMHHGLLLGGKRVRPFLVYATGEMLGITADQLDNAAAAIECIHAYSLIHDDLPAMDDDELRRGQPTVHIAFDEATAILAGDALQTLAFELLSRTSDKLSSKTQLSMVQSLSRASGYLGMCGGQAMDLAATNNQIDVTQLKRIHNLKTGALLRCAVELASIAAETQPEAHQSLVQYAEDLGLAFQVHDDILDVTSDTGTLGKPQGSDIAANKSTYPALLGLDEAKAKAHELQHSALQALSCLPYNSEKLEAFAHFIIQRNH